MSKKNVLVIEDDEDIASLIRYNLDKGGYKAHCSFSGEAGLDEAQKNVPDIILLDLMLPGLDGFSVCKKLKELRKTKNTPVIIVSARGEENDIVKGLECGADDYIIKPFSPKVMVARIASVLRRYESAAPKITANEDVVSVHELKINPGKREVFLAGNKIELSETEFLL